MSDSSNQRARHVFYFAETARTFCYAVIFTASALYQIETVALTPLQLVLVGTVLESVYFVFQIPTGVVADVYSRRLSIIIGFIGTGLAFVVEGSIPTFGGVIVAMVIWGVAVTFIDGALEAWVADELGESRAEHAFFRADQLGSIAGLFGIVLSTVLMRQVGLALPVVLGGVSITLVGVLLIFVMPERHFARRVDRAHNPFTAMSATLRDGVRTISANRILLLLTFVSLINGLWSEGFDRLWTKHLISTFDLPRVGWLTSEIEWFGTIRLVVALLSISVVELIRRRLKFDQDQRIARAVTGLTLAMAAALLVFALAGNFGLALVAYLATAMLRSPLATVRLNWVNRLISRAVSGDTGNVRATVLSLWSQADALGQVAGGPVVGAVGNVTLRGAMALCALILSSKLFVLRAMRRES